MLNFYETPPISLSGRISKHSLFQIPLIPFLGEHTGNKALFHIVKAVLSFPFLIEGSSIHKEISLTFNHHPDLGETSVDIPLLHRAGKKQTNMFGASMSTMHVIFMTH